MLIKESMEENKNKTLTKFKSFVRKKTPIKNIYERKLKNIKYHEEILKTPEKSKAKLQPRGSSSYSYITKRPNTPARREGSFQIADNNLSFEIKGDTKLSKSTLPEISTDSKIQSLSSIITSFQKNKLTPIKDKDDKFSRNFRSKKALVFQEDKKDLKTPIKSVPIA